MVSQTRIGDGLKEIQEAGLLPSCLQQQLDLTLTQTVTLVHELLLSCGHMCCMSARLYRKRLHRYVSHLLLELLSIGRSFSSEQVEWAMCRVTEALQLLLSVALLSCLYSPLLLGGPLMGGRGRVAPACYAQPLTC